MKPNPLFQSLSPSFRIRRFLALAALCLGMLFTFSPLAPALAAEDMAGLAEAVDPNAPWQLEADKLVTLHDANIVEAEGMVVLRQGDNYLVADFARFFRDTRWVYLSGNVKASFSGNEMEADQAEFDLDHQVGWLKNGRIFLAEPHLYFTGANVQKFEGDTYRFHKAKLTACEGPVPAWSFEADQGDLTLDGYATLQGSRFNVKDVPVAYAPYMIVPAKTTRQSGMLFPEFGYTTRLGVFFNLPIYWALDEENDLTFYEYGMSNRGFMQGAEYRHYWDLDTKGLWRVDWLWDAEIAQSERAEEPPLDDDGLVRDNQNRYWIRSKFDSRLYGFDVKLDLDYVSDQNYLREFSSGFSGFNKSRDAFMDEFSRDIAERDQNRVSMLLVTKEWDEAAVHARMHYTQNVAVGHGNLDPANDTTLQRLPQVDAYLYKDTVPGLDESIPLELEAEAQATQFTRNRGTTGKRFDVRPRLSVPLVSPYGSVIAAAGLRHTQYLIDRFETTIFAEDHEYASSRTMWDAEASAFTELIRVYEMIGDEPLLPSVENLGETRWAAIRHSIQPRVDYVARPYRDQSENPYFDEIDRLGEINEVTFSLTNVLTRKKQTVVMRSDQAEPEPAVSEDYLDFMRFRIQTSYDFVEGAREEDLDGHPSRPWSDVHWELTFAYNDYVSLTSRTWLSPYLGKITEHEHLLNIEIPDRVRFTYALDFQEDIDEYKRPARGEISTFRAELELYLLYGWKVGGAYERDTVVQTDLERSIFISYQHQCFDVSLMYSQRHMEDRFEAWVNLVGINFIPE